MSDNPFQPTAPYKDPNAAATGASIKPGGVTIFSIFCLILGILGLIASCFGGIGMAFMGTAIEMIENVPTSPQMSEDQKAVQIEALKLTQSSMGVQIGLIVVNLFVATLLVVGGFACLTGKSSTVLKMATLVAAIFVIIRCVVSIFMVQLPSWTKLQKMPGWDDSQQMAQMFGLGFAVIVPVVLAGFYLWTHFYLKSESVTRYFDSK